MKIEEVVKLYELISNISWWGLIGIFLLAIVILLGTYALFIKEKSDRKINQLYLKIGGLSLIILALALTILKIDADNRKDLVMKANQVKSTFLSNGYKLLGFHRLRTFLPSNEFPDRTLHKLIKSYSSEFIEVKLEDPSDSIGMRLIDPASINKIDDYNLSHLPYLAETIKYFMSRNQIDTLSYQDVRKRIDVYFDDEWIELMLSKYDSVFTPYSVYDTKARYSENHKFKLKKTKESQPNNF